MTVTSGQTQGWSFSLKHNAPWTQPYGGSFSVTGVSTNGTGTATVQGGSPPDTNSTAIRTGFSGFTQGIVIDSSSAITLAPTTDFVTARACYRVTAASAQGTYATTLQFTHDIGNPQVRSVITQQGTSNIPCANNFTLNVKVGGCSPQSYPSCTLQGMGGTGTPTGDPGKPAGDVIPAGAGATCVKFMRGDSNQDRSLDISDAVFTLAYLFLGGAAPGCLDTVDSNDDSATDVSDPIYLLAYLFTGGEEPPPPLTMCGHDYTPDQVTCVSYPDCGASQCGCPLPPLKELTATSTPTSFNSERMASKDVQMADFDADGDLDCFVPQSRGGPCQPDHVYLNRINESPSKIEPRGDLTNTANGDYDGMGNWNLLMSQNASCYPWTEDCNDIFTLCAGFEVTYGSVVVDVGSPGGGGPDGKPDVVTVGGGDFMRVLINLGGNPPTFEDQSGKLEFDSNAGRICLPCS
jgi:hypothetical protein